MRRLIQILGITLIALSVMIAVSLNTRLSNMKSEYATAQAIRDLDSYVRENHGHWPTSPEHLENRYPSGGEVVIDYSITASELIADPAKFRNAVRPRSGKFYTYPNYEEQIDKLLQTLREANRTEQDAELKNPE